MTDATIPAAPSRTLLQRGPDFVVWGGVILLLLISFQPVEMGNAAKLFTNSENMRQFGAEFLKPDFTEWKLYVGQMWLTVQIALWGTGLAILMAVPLGLLASRNMSPVEICGNPVACSSNLACVPLPAPGTPNNTT